MNDWTAEDAHKTYAIPQWSEGYFDVDPAGRLVAQPGGDPNRGRIPLPELADEARAAGLRLPLLVRFTDILRDRVDGLCDAFHAAMAADGYQGRYTAVYPIKVNQQRSVVEEILRHGGDRVGLEAGSKPELMAVLALAGDNQRVIICNGYKDREYLRLALVGRRLGHRVYVVVEKRSELELLLAEADKLGIEPLIGVRVRLASIAYGKWQNTGGEKSKFGLAANQVLSVVEHLRQTGRLDCLELLHFHMGSQIANIRDMQRGLREAARFYAELQRLGAPIRVVDAGGGLGVDYEGTRSRTECSINYTVAEYAKNVVHALWEVCQEQDLPHPDLVTEAGRAMTAHHAVLITNVIDTETAGGNGKPDAPASGDPLILHDLWRTYQDVGTRSPVELYHDAVHWISECNEMYNHGVLGLGQRARAEATYFALCQELLAHLSPGSRRHRAILDELHERLADKYFCNFSVFQSMPDVWAINQIFPILPLQRLDERPDRRAVLQDLTCDSDGRIDYYVDSEGVESTLPLHPVAPGEPYLLGFFLVGAYQEILGDMHNLFGDTDSVNVTLAPDGTYRLSQPRHGDSVDTVLRYVSYSPEALLKALREKVRTAGDGDPASRAMRLDLEAGLTGYTYLEE